MLVPFAADSPRHHEQNGAFCPNPDLLPQCRFQLASAAGERGVGGGLRLPAGGNQLRRADRREEGGGVQQVLAAAGTGGQGEHGGGEGVREEVLAQAALQLQEGGVGADLGKSSTGSEPP